MFTVTERRITRRRLRTMEEEGNDTNRRISREEFMNVGGTNPLDGMFFDVPTVLADYHDYPDADRLASMPTEA